jgi:hypothetical protein
MPCVQQKIAALPLATRIIKTDAFAIKMEPAWNSLLIGATNALMRTCLLYLKDNAAQSAIHLSAIITVINIINFITTFITNAIMGWAGSAKLRNSPLVCARKMAIALQRSLIFVTTVQMKAIWQFS